MNDWQAFLARSHPDDHLAMLDAWQHADISAGSRYGGELAQALDAIRAICLVMPSASDMYFSAAEIVDEARLIRRARIHPIETVWGHRVNHPRQNPDDARVVETQLRALLESKA